MFEKIFDSFPFRFIISILFGGIIFALTPTNSELLLKFGKWLFIIFFALISFVFLSFVMWIYNLIVKFIKKLKNQKTNIEQNQKEFDDYLEENRLKLFETTNQWSKKDIEIFKQLILNNDEPYRIEGEHQYYNDKCFFNSIFVESKREIIPIEYPEGTKITINTPVANLYTLYWIKEEYLPILKAIYEKYGKLNKFDK